MKRLQLLLFAALLLAVACKKSQQTKTNSNSISIVVAGKVLLNDNDIEYYDSSSHIFYLKNPQTIDIEQGGAFSVYADTQEVYKGSIVPTYSSYMPTGIFITPSYSKENTFTIPISFSGRISESGVELVKDERNDSRIIDVLKKNQKLRAGLAVEIASIQYNSPQNVAVQLKLTNKDNINYYHFDPNKMGLPLFHYYTNGLYVWDAINKKYWTSKMQSEMPEPWNSWKTQWLSIIKPNETKLITLNYQNFDAIPSGTYRSYISFPGMPSYLVSKQDLQQPQGTIWLGEITVEKDFSVK